jgi:hypothetical protein
MKPSGNTSYCVMPSCFYHGSSTLSSGFHFAFCHASHSSWTRSSGSEENDSDSEESMDSSQQLHLCQMARENAGSANDSVSLSSNLESPLPVWCILTRLPNSEFISLFDSGCDTSVFGKGWLIVKDLNQIIYCLGPFLSSGCSNKLHAISPMPFHFWVPWDVPWSQFLFSSIRVLLLMIHDRLKHSLVQVSSCTMVLWLTWSHLFRLIAAAPLIDHGSLHSPTALDFSAIYILMPPKRLIHS